MSSFILQLFNHFCEHPDYQFLNSACHRLAVSLLLSSFSGVLSCSFIWAMFLCLSPPVIWWGAEPYVLARAGKVSLLHFGAVLPYILSAPAARLRLSYHLNECFFFNSLVVELPYKWFPGSSGYSLFLNWLLPSFGFARKWSIYAYAFTLARASISSLDKVSPTLSKASLPRNVPISASRISSPISLPLCGLTQLKWYFLGRLPWSSLLRLDTHIMCAHVFLYFVPPLPLLRV